MEQHEKNEYGDSVPLRVRLRAMSGRQRLSYLWYYYRLPFLIALGALVLLGLFVRDWQRGGDSFLTVTLVNADAARAEESGLFTAFPSAFGYAPEDAVTVDATLRVDLARQDAASAHSYQILAAEFLTGEIDLFVSDPELFAALAQNGAFAPLTEYLEPDQLEAWQGALLYPPDAAPAALPDAGQPEPCGVLLRCCALHRAGVYPESQAVAVGIGGRSGNPEAAAQMLDFLQNYGM